MNRLLSILTTTLSLAVIVSCSPKGLTKTESEALIMEKLASRNSDYIEKFGKEWQDSILWNGKDSMKFSYKVFGEKPADGRALYISMHGGGGAPPKVNDQQWQNQKRLYTPQEGVYFVPRSPSDSWNMWHQEYMDGFIEKLLILASEYEDVNPNKIYVMGYSAGGDGTYQLAPRLADLWAAAAMSAGHPGDAQMESLRNLPFALFMGGQDTPYNRNKLAEEWKVKHEALAAVDKGAYITDIHIYPQYGHWMQREDSISMSWMPKFKRNPIPSKVVWVQDDVIRPKFYWLQATGEGLKQHAKIVASYSDGTINVEECSADSLIVGINDNMMDLDKPVEILYEGKSIFKGEIPRKVENIEDDINALRDKDLIFPARVLIKSDGVTIL